MGAVGHGGRASGGETTPCVRGCRPIASAASFLSIGGSILLLWVLTPSLSRWLGPCARLYHLVFLSQGGMSWLVFSIITVSILMLPGFTTYGSIFSCTVYCGGTFSQHSCGVCSC